ncbi:MAG: homoserine kinase [Candidatus Ozemobacteraceae bacterium]
MEKSVQKQKPIRAYAPASIGNFAVGFDVLGAALRPIDGNPWGDVVEVGPADDSARQTTLSVEGPFGHLIPNDATNLVMVSWELYHRKLRQKRKSIPHVSLTLYKNLPLCSGLGSSASSVAATLRAANVFFDHALKEETLLQLAGRAEGTVSGAVHLDNVAPALLGGLRLITPGGIRQPERAFPLPFFDHWRIVVIHPNLSVPTRKARQVLPPAIPLFDAVAYWQNFGAFIHALHSADEELAAITLRDILIEGYRRRLVRGFGQVKTTAMKYGALGCSLSGSGPSIFAVTDSDQTARRVKAAMIAAFKMRGIASDGHICVLDQDGAREC